MVSIINAWISGDVKMFLMEHLFPINVPPSHLINISRHMTQISRMFTGINSLVNNIQQMQLTGMIFSVVNMVYKIYATDNKQ